MGFKAFYYRTNIVLRVLEQLFGGFKTANLNGDFVLPVLVGYLRAVL